MNQLPKILAIAATACVITASQQLAAHEFIRQKQILTGLTWDYYVSSEKGTTWSPIPVGKEGSSLMLYAQGTYPDNRLYKLDETTLGSDFPSAQITIQSEDPHIPARTRADRPFKVSLLVKGLSTSRKKISIHHQGTPYQPALHAPSAQATAHNLGWWTIKKEGSSQGTFYPGIPTSNATQAEGIETFHTYALTNNTTQKGGVSRPLQSASIQVWPVSTATIQGLAPGVILSGAQLKKTVSVQCQDLYPDSTTYVQIYRGESKLGTKGTILPQSVIRFDTIVPQDQLIPLGEWRDTLADGKYTIEVLTLTPFNQGKPERLAHTTFVLDRGMHAPSMVTRESK